MNEFDTYGKKSTKSRARRKELEMLGDFADSDSDDDGARPAKRGRRESTKDTSGEGVAFVSGSSMLLPSEPLPPPSSRPAPAGAADRSYASTYVPRESRKPGENVADWEKHTKGIGSRLMAKMGYLGGGLGKTTIGIAKPVEVKLRPKQMGIGYNDFDERTSQSKEDFRDLPMSDEEEKPASVAVPRSSRGEGAWKKSDKQKKRVYEQAPVQTGESQKILIYGAGGVRQVTSLADVLHKENAAEGAFLPELRHNMTLLVDMREAKQHSLEQRVQAAESNIKRMSQEVGKRTIQSSEANEKAQVLADIIEILGGVERQAAKLPPIQLLSALLKLFQLIPATLSSARRSIFVHRVVPTFANALKDWNPLNHPKLPLDILEPWHKVLMNDESAEPMLFARLCHGAVLPRLRFAFLDENWDARADIDRAIEVVKAWKPVLPASVRLRFMRDVVIARLRREVEVKWNPRKDRVLVSDWALPWRAVLSNYELAPLDEAIRNQLASILNHWDPMDASALVLLAPWASNQAWGRVAADAFVRRAIVPRLIWHLAQLPPRLLLDMLLPPPTPDNAGWAAFTRWIPLMEASTRTSLMVQAFLPRWFIALHAALVSRQVQFDVVAQWYMTWKQLVSNFVLGDSAVDLDERLVRAFQLALEMMQAAMAGHVPALPAPALYQQINIDKVKAPQTGAAAPTFAQLSKEAQSLRDLIEREAQERGIVFAPTKKQHDNRQIYSFGGVLMYVDPQRDLIVAHRSDQWQPTSLERLIDIAKKSQ